MNNSIKKGYSCEPTDTVHHPLNSEQNFRNQSCTSSTIIPFPYAPALVPLSAVLQHNTLSECVRKRWSKAPVQSFCCEDDTTRCCAFLRLYRINTLTTNLRKHFIFIQNTVKPHRPLSQVFPKDDCLSSRPKLHFQVGFKGIRKIKNGDIKYVNTYTFASTVTSTYF